MIDYQNFRKRIYFFGFKLRVTPNKEWRITFKKMKNFPNLEKEVENFKINIFKEFRSAYNEALELRIKDYIKQQAVENLNELYEYSKEQGLTELEEGYTNDIFDIQKNQINSEDIQSIKENKKSVIEEDIKERADFDKIKDECKKLPFFVKSGQLIKILNISFDDFYSLQKKIKKQMPCYKFGIETYRYKKSDVLNYLKIDLSSSESDIIKYLKKIENNFITKSDFIKLLGVSWSSFSNSQKEIEKFVSSLKTGKNDCVYRKSDIIKFIERGGLDA